jgi:hypothetical protein
MFRDNYTNFSFNEQDSSNFKVWLTNKNDLKLNMSPNFSDKFNSPQNSDLRYYEGTTIDKQEIKISCVAIDITFNEWRAITEWLSPLKIGKLRFDWNKKYYYMVKLNKAPSGSMFIKGKIDNTLGQLYIVTFDLEFTTVEDWAALGEYGEQKHIVNDDDISISVFNNPYYFPCVVDKKRLPNLNISDAGTGRQITGYKTINIDLSKSSLVTEGSFTYGYGNYPSFCVDDKRYPLTDFLQSFSVYNFEEIHLGPMHYTVKNNSVRISDIAD